MFTFLVDAFFCFLLAAGILATIIVHASWIRSDGAAVSVVIYAIATTLLGWTGNVRNLLCITLPFTCASIVAMTYFELEYTLTLTIVMLITCVLIIAYLKLTSPAVKQLG